MFLFFSSQTSCATATPMMKVMHKEGKKKDVYRFGILPNNLYCLYLVKSCDRFVAYSSIHFSTHFHPMESYLLFHLESVSRNMISGNENIVLTC